MQHLVVPSDNRVLGGGVVMLQVNDFILIKCKAETVLVWLDREPAWCSRTDNPQDTIDRLAKLFGKILTKLVKHAKLVKYVNSVFWRIFDEIWPNLIKLPMGAFLDMRSLFTHFLPPSLLHDYFSPDVPSQPLGHKELNFAMTTLSQTYSISIFFIVHLLDFQAVWLNNKKKTEKSLEF